MLLMLIFHQLFCMAWSPNGSQLATFGRDCLLSIFEPRSGSSPVTKLSCAMGSRGARIVWLEDSVVAVSGFTKYVCKCAAQVRISYQSLQI